MRVNLYKLTRTLGGKQQVAQGEFLADDPCTTPLMIRWMFPVH